MTPIIKASIAKNTPLANLNSVKIAKLASGINSVIEIPIIMVKEKLKQKVINLLIFSLFHLKKITKEPKTVDNPAILEIIIGIKKSIESPTKFYESTIQNRTI